MGEHKKQIILTSYCFGDNGKVADGPHHWKLDFGNWLSFQWWGQLGTQAFLTLLVNFDPFFLLFGLVGDYIVYKINKIYIYIRPRKYRVFQFFLIWYRVIQWKYSVFQKSELLQKHLKFVFEGSNHIRMNTGCQKCLL